MSMVGTANTTIRALRNGLTCFLTGASPVLGVSGPEVLDIIVPFYAGRDARQKFPRERKQHRWRCCLRVFARGASVLATDTAVSNVAGAVEYSRPRRVARARVTIRHWLW